MSTKCASLVADIGGTHARFALVDEEGGQLRAIEVLPCRHYDHPEQAVADYLERVGEDSVGQACLAVACPVRGGRVKMTNNPWCIYPKQLQEQFGWSACKLINDFSAMALGTIRVPEACLVHVCGGPGDPTSPRLVMGPGTGLGVGALVPTRKGWVPLATEGGHVDYAPTTELDVEVHRLLREQFGRVSVERILSGPGLVNLYRAQSQVQRVSVRFSTPEEITSAALRGSDALAMDALQHFCEILGRTAGNAVLTQGSYGGVYLCGGILPGILDFLLNSRFRDGFEDKGRMRSLMESTPVYVVTDAYTGLRGAAEALRNDEV
ncbi:glucokinase [Marinobacter daepoensis]|uniref:Glucokinase n=1 Tax=Marinobacter daepoensis TaxID=262077 RepID=A0ABS3BCZ4_9GAMM|nr:glucokinase [Marinobacter daepoensis]MBN7769466.1 glucokinase [Marinobacter daepoensis]MBY6078156.1 glucokinase [Marinobacter daepoensis]